MSNPLFLNHPHFRPLLPLRSSHMDLCLGLIRETENFMERNRIVDGIYGANQDALDVIKTYSFLHESEMAEAVNKLEGQQGRDAFFVCVGLRKAVGMGTPLHAEKRKGSIACRRSSCWCY